MSELIMDVSAVAVIHEQVLFLCFVLRWSAHAVRTNSSSSHHRQQGRHRHCEVLAHRARPARDGHQVRWKPHSRFVVFLFCVRPGFIHPRSQSLETESRVSSANSLTSGWISCCSAPAACYQPVLCFSSTGSPLQFYVDAINSGHVTAYGPGLTHGTVNRPAAFTIVTKDAGEGTDTLTCNIQVSAICTKIKLCFTSKTKRKTSSSRRSKEKLHQMFHQFIQQYLFEDSSCFMIHLRKNK